MVYKILPRYFNLCLQMFPEPYETGVKNKLLHVNLIFQIQLTCHLIRKFKICEEHWRTINADNNFDNTH